MTDPIPGPEDLDDAINEVARARVALDALAKLDLTAEAGLVQKALAGIDMSAVAQARKALAQVDLSAVGQVQEALAQVDLSVVAQVQEALAKLDLTADYISAGAEVREAFAKVDLSAVVQAQAAMARLDVPKMMRAHAAAARALRSL